MAQQLKPRTTLASQIPALKHYGITLVAGSPLFMYLNRGVWQFSHQIDELVLGVIIYAVLGIMLICGIVLLMSKSKTTVNTWLNVLIYACIFVAIFSLLSINVFTIVIPFLVIRSIVKIKQTVNLAP